jgi:hypothetical protein
MRRRGATAVSLAVAAAALLFAVSPATAYFDRIEIGARGLALAGAYQAATRDVSSAYWNPAGLSLTEQPQVLFTYSRPYMVGGLISSSAVGGIPLRFTDGAAALTWHRLGLDGVVSENLIGLSYGRWIYRDNERTIHVGGTVEAAIVSYDSQANYNQLTGDRGRDFGSQSKLTGNVGILWQERSRVRFGAVLRHLGSPEFHFIEHGTGTPMPSGLELSVAYQWRPESQIMFSRSDVGDHVTYNYAGEIWFYDVFAVRAGVDDTEFSGGIGIKGRTWEVDTAFLTHKALGNTYRASLHFILPEKGRKP